VAIGAKKEDEDVAICLLRSLPKSYENVVLHVEMSSAQLKTQEVIKVLTNEHIKRAGGMKIAPAKSDDRTKAFVSEQDPRVCSFRGKTGHSVDRCWTKNKQESRKPQGGRFGAKRANHVQHDYYDDDDTIAFVVSMEPTLAADTSMVGKWAIDSGATVAKIWQHLEEAWGGAWPSSVTEVDSRMNVLIPGSVLLCLLYH
jgi:hypothetical protein